MFHVFFREERFDMKYKASVVVPIYNGEKYLVRCVDSILNQTYAEYIQIILVNDGSNDHTDDICKQYELNNTNVVYIKKENAGVWQARKTGLNSALGEWITFVDCDDWCELEMIECLVREAEEKNTLMVASSNMNLVLNHLQVIEAALEHTYLGYTLHGLLFNTLLLKSCYNKTLDISRGEDTIVIARYVISDEKIELALIDKELYHYFADNPEGLSAKDTAQAKYDMGLYLNEMAHICREQGFKKLAKDYYNRYLDFMIIANKYAVLEKNKKLKNISYKRFSKDWNQYEKYDNLIKTVLFLCKILNNPIWVRYKLIK